MPGINIVRLKPLTAATNRHAAATERVATALEAICRQHLGIEVTVPVVVAEDDATPAVTFATDEDTTARLLDEELRRMGIKGPLGEDAE